MSIFSLANLSTSPRTWLTCREGGWGGGEKGWVIWRDQEGGQPEGSGEGLEVDRVDGDEGESEGQLNFRDQGGGEGERGGSRVDGRRLEAAEKPMDPIHGNILVPPHEHLYPESFIPVPHTVHTWKSMCSCSPCSLRSTSALHTVHTYIPHRSHLEVNVFIQTLQPPVHLGPHLGGDPRPHRRHLVLRALLDTLRMAR